MTPPAGAEMMWWKGKRTGADGEQEGERKVMECERNALIPSSSSPHFLNFVLETEDRTVDLK